MSNNGKLTENEPTEGANAQSLPTPGTMLRSAREAAQLSVRDVAEQLNLVSSQVAALEDDRYDYFHAEIFCKGYMRAYGKLLGIAPEQLMAAYTRQCPSQPEMTSSAPKQVRHVQIPLKGHSIQYWFVAATIAIVTVMWLLSSDSQSKSIMSLVDDEQLLTVDQHDRSFVQSLEYRNGKQAEQKAQATDLISVSSAHSLILGSHSSGEPETVDLLPAVTDRRGTVSSAFVQSNTATVERANPSLVQDVLNFRFSADCWVKVIDSDNNVLVADLKRAKEVLKLLGRAPFRVILGYAPAVSLEYNGEYVSINSNTDSNTARLVVGQS